MKQLRTNGSSRPPARRQQGRQRRRGVRHMELHQLRAGEPEGAARQDQNQAPARAQPLPARLRRAERVLMPVFTIPIHELREFNPLVTPRRAPRQAAGSATGDASSACPARSRPSRFCWRPTGRRRPSSRRRSGCCSAKCPSTATSTCGAPAGQHVVLHEREPDSRRDASGRLHGGDADNPPHRALPARPRQLRHHASRRAQALCATGNNLAPRTPEEGGGHR